MIKIKPSSNNTNRHTKQGMELLEKSIDKVGVIDKKLFTITQSEK